MFNYQGWGGFFEWRLGPAHQMFVDGRIETHPPYVFLDYLSVEGGSAGWEQTLAKYGVDHLVLSYKYQADLIALVRASPHWRSTYDDGQAAIFVRAG